MSNKEYAKVIANNLRNMMYEHGKTQADIARDLNINKATLSSWMNGTRIPRMAKIDLLCHYFNCSRSDIMEVREKKMPITRDTVPAIRIPVLGYVAAGVPISAIQDVLDWEEIAPDVSLHGEFFGLKIKGDSMAPRIVEGDVVIVRCQNDAESGDVVIAQVNGDSATCKRLSKYAAGISLISFNPMYPPMNYTNEEIEKLPVTIIGKVIENRQKF